MSSEEDIMVVAFCWYEQSEWETLKRTAADKEILDDTYDEWKNNANEAISEIQAQGTSSTEDKHQDGTSRGLVRRAER